MERKTDEQERGPERAKRVGRGKARQRKPDRSREMRQEQGLQDSEKERLGLKKASLTETLRPPTLAFRRPTPVILLFSKCP